MRFTAIGLGLCLTLGLLSSPLAAAVHKSGDGVVPAKFKKNKSKVKPHKAQKRKAHPVTRH